MQQQVTFNTSGDGYWSGKRKAVRVVDMRLSYTNDDNTFGELCVYFDTEDWDVDTEGLIYTDSGFLSDLHAFLQQHGLKGHVDYSEQGMQGDDFVSCDVNEQFIASWREKFAVVA